MVKSTFKIGLLALVAALPSVATVAAQEGLGAGDTDAVPPVAVLQEKVREWVRVQKLRGEESADWAEQQRRLAGLNALRREEIGQIDALIEAAGTRLADATEQREKLLAEQVALRASRAELARRIDDLEATLRTQIATFPDPLLEKIEDSLARMEAEGADRPLQDRYRDVVAVLVAAGEFGRSLTVVSEMRDIGGQRIEVEVLYLGLSGAWYVDRGGKHAGAGRAGVDGWVWTEDKSIAGRVRDAIDMHRKKVSPGYVRLPFAAREGGGE